MELKNKNDYYNGDSDKEYILPDINNEVDINKIIDTLEHEYGIFEEITCIKKDMNEGIEYFKEFNNTNEFKNEFKIDNFGIIIFNCKDKYISFIMNNDMKTLRILDRQNTLGDKKYNQDKVKYYKDEYDNIIKYDGNNGLFYLLDTKLNKFIIKNEIASSFYGDGGYKEIVYDEEKTDRDIHR